MQGYLPNLNGTTWDILGDRLNDAHEHGENVYRGYLKLIIIKQLIHIVVYFFLKKANTLR